MPLLVVTEAGVGAEGAGKRPGSPGQGAEVGTELAFTQVLFDALRVIPAANGNRGSALIHS